MHRTFVAALALVCLGACSSGRVVATAGDPTPKAPPHPVYGPVASLGIPPGHYPPPGACRVWVPGRPPGHQPDPCPCASLVAGVPAGAWVLYRPLDGNVLEVTAYDPKSPKVVASVTWYDLGSGELIRATKGGNPASHGKPEKPGKAKRKSKDKQG